jgi:glycosyltransferase involved in cell wall biosynthesis
VSKHLAFINPINEFYSPVSGGAVATILMQNARELARRGYKVSVLTPVNADETYDAGEIVPVRAPRRADLNLFQRALSRLSERKNKWGWPYYEHYLDSVIRELRKLDPTPDAMIFFNDLVAPSHVRRHLPKPRLLVNLQNEIRLNRPNPTPLFANIDKLLACSRHIRDWTAAEYRLPDDKLAVLTSGVDLEAFFPREDYLEPKPGLRVLFVGRIDRNKGPDIAADAVATLRREGLPVEFTVAGGLWFYGHGKEDEDPYFRLLKEKLDAAEARYLGHVTRKEIGKVFREHDVVCVLSRSTEPFGLVVLEAMASGCAVVASNRGGLPDACGRAGALLDPDDFTAVVGALRRFCQEPAALAHAKQECRAHALGCSWASKVDELEKLL